ncbi:hypothetical protein EGW08_005276 [Elysia chlorotica]|uniref:Lipocalin/cytosolic fatty-acid binding domain-containing protein n=1 Tax=Elysia chlorotica TaxID=188477 RepID=A0A3S1BM72_ELYCH|nr:hypothetical protein EGW08_005276 [Elysia chlorotica]
MTEKLLNIRFKSDTEEGLEEYLAAQNVGLVLRKIVKSLTLHETLTQEGDTFTHHFESSFKNHKMVFKLGEPFTDCGVDGRVMRTTVYVEGDTLITSQENTKDGDVPCRIERRVRDDGKLAIKLISVPTQTACNRVFVPVEKK